VEKERPASTRSSRRTFWRSWEGEGMTGGGVPTAAEAAARGASSVRGFSTRNAAKFWSSSCSRRRESHWGGWIGRKRGGGMGLTGIEAHRRGGSDGEVVPVGVRPRGVAWECQWGEGKLPRGL
jgi:hypothetical protein